MRLIDADELMKNARYIETKKEVSEAPTVMGKIEYMFAREFLDMVSQKIDEAFLKGVSNDQD